MRKKLFLGCCLVLVVALSASGAEVLVEHNVPVPMSDGTNVDVTSGMVRARYRHSVEKPQLLKPEETTEFSIRMRPTAHQFQAGHRIRLDITSSDFPNYDRNHNT